MARLPVPGSDEGAWGALLNEFLRISHHEDGTLRGIIEVVNVKDYGNDTAALQAALSAIGSDKKTLLIPHQLNVTVDITVPSNVTLYFPQGGALNISAGVKVTINGPIEAGMWQVFDGDGTVSGSPMCDYFYPQWFGVVGDGVADDSGALQKAFHACAATGKTLYFSQDLSIRVTKNLFVYDKFDLVGENTNAEIVLDADLDPGADEIAIDNLRLYWINFGIPSKGGTPTTYTGSVSNLQFRATGNAVVHSLLWFHRAERFTVAGCYFDVTATISHGDTEPFGNNATPIEGGNNNKWCPASPPLRKYGRLLNNQ